MNLKLLNAVIDEVGIPLSTIAEKTGISRRSLYLKLAGEREFKVSELNTIAELFRLTDEEKTMIFFGKQGDKI